MQTYRLIRPHVVSISGTGIVGEQLSIRQIDSVLLRLAAWQSNDATRDFSRFSGKVSVTWNRGGIIFPIIPIESRVTKRTEIFEPLRAICSLPDNHDGLKTVFHLQDGVMCGMEHVRTMEYKNVNLKEFFRGSRNAA